MKGLSEVGLARPLALASRFARGPAENVEEVGKYRFIRKLDGPGAPGKPLENFLGPCHLVDRIQEDLGAQAFASIGTRLLGRSSQRD